MSTDSTGQWYARPRARSWVADATPVRAREFHATLPGYAPTPLVATPHLARELGVAAVWVKDESTRLGLAAFKVLGASWAISRLIAARTGAGVSDLDRLRGAAAGSGLELVTATDGNHGRAVARMARLLGLGATVFVPAGMTTHAADAIAAEGAQIERGDGDYDAAVAAAARYAGGAPGRELVQDTAWEGYQQVPGWIVEGYGTLLSEIDEQLGHSPDLVAIPVGVGSLAQAVVSHYRSGAARPGLLSVEPEGAACVLESVRAGSPVSVPTGATVMAGLNCGTVSAGAWPVLRDGLDGAIAVSDAQALRAATDLNRVGISSGPSGAASLAGARAALAVPQRRTELGVTGASTVVLLNTEGA